MLVIKNHLVIIYYCYSNDRIAGLQLLV